MQLNDKFYQLFLQEMKLLDGFRQNYASSHGTTALQDEEPDVKRLLEAMAFFNARTQNAATQQMLKTQLRIFQQHYPYLLTPLPSMAMLQPVITPSCAEPAHFPSGTEVVMSTENNENAIFRTMTDTTVLPVVSDKYRTQHLENGKTRVEVSFKSFFPRNDEVQDISLAINYLNNFYTSIQLLSEMKEHLRNISVRFESESKKESREQKCSFSFGSMNKGLFSNSHPLEILRHFFHFPRLDLFLNISVPRPPRNWEKFSLFLEFDTSWPQELVIHEGTFTLSAVPVINLNHGYAAPFTYDGTQSETHLRHAESEFKYELHSLTAVMKSTDDGLEPLRAGILSDGNGTYEIDINRTAGSSSSNTLHLNMPEAFMEPCTLTAEGFWFQPWFSTKLNSKPEIKLFRRFAQGINWTLAGAIAPHRETPLLHNLKTFTKILALKSKEQYSFEDLSFILSILGCKDNAFKDLFATFYDVEVAQKTSMRNNKLLPSYQYKLKFRHQPSSLEPVICILKEKLQKFLQAWSSESEIEII